MLTRQSMAREQRKLTDQGSSDFFWVESRLRRSFMTAVSLHMRGWATGTYRKASKLSLSLKFFEFLTNEWGDVFGLILSSCRASLSRGKETWQNDRQSVVMDLHSCWDMCVEFKILREWVERSSHVCGKLLDGHTKQFAILILFRIDFFN